MSATQERTRYVGAPVKRREDAALLRGRGTFVDNMAPVGTVTMAVVRSPYAHARVASIDATAARAVSDVAANAGSSRSEILDVSSLAFLCRPFRLAKTG